MIRLLILINVMVFVAELFAGDELLHSFALWPPVMSARDVDRVFMPWQLVTYAFLHANGMHLALNMFSGWMSRCTDPCRIR